MKPYELADRESYGLATDDHSTFALAALEAECLAVTGQHDRASALAGRLLEVMERQKISVQDDHVTEGRAVLYFIDGDSRAAAELLRQKLQQGVLRWVFFRFSPATSLFEQDPELRDLKGQVQAHLNEERTKLGWEPVEI